MNMAFFKESISKANVFPNPTDGEINIKKDLSAFNNCILSIFDIEGKEQMRTQIPVSQIVFKKKIDLLQDGMYLIRIICDDKII